MTSRHSFGEKVVFSYLLGVGKGKLTDREPIGLGGGKGKAIRRKEKKKKKPVGMSLRFSGKGEEETWSVYQFKERKGRKGIGWKPGSVRDGKGGKRLWSFSHEEKEGKVLRLCGKGGEAWTLKKKKEEGVTR